MDKKDHRITMRVTEKEKKRIEEIAKKCDLSLTEYLRQRGLGYEPRGTAPEGLFLFCEKMDALIDRNISPEVNEEALVLLRAISRDIISPAKEDMKKWQPQDSGPSKAD